jgi:hypothetical protein
MRDEAKRYMEVEERRRGGDIGRGGAGGRGEGESEVGAGSTSHCIAPSGLGPPPTMQNYTRICS